MMSVTAECLYEVADGVLAVEDDKEQQSSFLKSLIAIIYDGRVSLHPERSSVPGPKRRATRSMHPDRERYRMREMGLMILKMHLFPKIM